MGMRLVGKRIPIVVSVRPVLLPKPDTPAIIAVGRVNTPRFPAVGANRFIERSGCLFLGESCPGPTNSGFDCSAGFVNHPNNRVVIAHCDLPE